MTQIVMLRFLIFALCLSLASAFTLAPRVPASLTLAPSRTEGIEMGRGDKRTAKGRPPLSKCTSAEARLATWVHDGLHVCATQVRGRPSPLANRRHTHHLI